MHDEPAEDLFFNLHYDGDFEMRKAFAVAGGTREVEERMLKELSLRYKATDSLDAAMALADEIWRIGADVDGNGEPDPALVHDARPEAGFLERDTGHERRFRLITQTDGDSRGR
jgi:hypothetical protein